MIHVSDTVKASLIIGLFSFAAVLVGLKIFGRKP